MTTRAHDNGPFKEFDPAEWTFDFMRDCCEGMKSDRFSARSDSFCNHMRNSAKETLLAMRDVLDAAINQMEEQQSKTE